MWHQHISNKEKEKTHMKKLKVLLVAVLSVTTLFGATISANAASTEVNIEIKATTMDNVSVTVPTTVPIVFNENGTNTLPTNWTIENRSTIAGIHLAKIEMTGVGEWKLLADTEDTRELEVDTKSIQFYAGKTGALKLVDPTEQHASNKGLVTFADTEVAIASGETQVLAFDVKRGAFTANEAMAKAFDMVLTFEFN